MAFQSVRTKVLMTIFFVTALYCAGMIVFTETFVTRKLQAMTVGRGVSIAKRLAADCANPVITENTFELTMMLKDLMSSEKDIVYACVLSETGRVLAHSFEGGVPTELAIAHRPASGQPFSVMELATSKGRVYDIAVPLLQGNVGVFRMGASSEAIERDVKDIERAILVFSIAVLAAGCLVSVWFSWNITRPLIDLTEAVEASGLKGGAPLDGVVSDDEIGELARVFNEIIGHRRLAEGERERLLQELQGALGKIKILRGFLPICASCKKIRDDQGYWNQIEEYIRDHSDAEFSHSICPECSKKLYPDFQEDA